MKKILVLLVLLVFICSCGKDTTKGTIEKIHYEETTKVTNYVKIETSKGIILAELYPEVAPITVENFQNLVKDKFYDNMIFHRVVQNFVIQAGDPTGTGRGGSETTIKGEFENNGVENNLSHTRGILSMARNSISMDSASSQFFIVQKDSTYLDGDYAAFGKVIAGLDVVDKIASVEVDAYQKPTVDQKLKSIRFVTIKEE